MPSPSPQDLKFLKIFGDDENGYASTTFVRIDNKVYVDAKGLFNRHPSNGFIRGVQILGWTQTGTSEFEIWYDNIEISIGGFGDSPV